MSSVAAAAFKAADDMAWMSILAFAGRLLIAAIFVLSGASKIADPNTAIGDMAWAGLPLANAGLVLAIVAEIGGGLALVVGYRARTAAAALAVFCLATAVLFHANFADQNQFIHFFKNLAMAGGLLQVIAFGAGRVSLDARRA